MCYVITHHRFELTALLGQFWRILIKISVGLIRTYQLVLIVVERHPDSELIHYLQIYLVLELCNLSPSSTSTYKYNKKTDANQQE